MNATGIPPGNASPGAAPSRTLRTYRIAWHETRTFLTLRSPFGPPCSLVGSCLQSGRDFPASRLRALRWDSQKIRYRLGFRESSARKTLLGSERNSLHGAVSQGCAASFRFNRNARNSSILEIARHVALEDRHRGDGAFAPIAAPSLFGKRLFVCAFCYVRSLACWLGA